MAGQYTADGERRERGRKAIRDDNRDGRLAVDDLDPVHRAVEASRRRRARLAAILK